MPGWVNTGQLTQLTTLYRVGLRLGVLYRPSNRNVTNSRHNLKILVLMPRDSLTRLSCTVLASLGGSIDKCIPAPKLDSIAMIF